jgi:Ca2+-binding RTX toxin-like protein
MEAEFLYLSEGADNVILIDEATFATSDRLSDDVGNVGFISGAVVFGLNGDDVIQGNPEAAEMINGNAGNDTIVGSGAADTLMGGQGDDLLFAGYLNTPFAVTIDLVGSSDDAPAVLEGNLGNDFIVGGRGADLLVGGLGDDTLLGNDGADLLVGDFGSDVLTGGAGSDRFFLRPSDGLDIITDFEPERDLIVLGQDIFEVDSLLVNFDRIELPGYISLTQQGADVLVGTTSFGNMAIVQNVTVEAIASQFAIPNF